MRGYIITAELRTTYKWKADEKGYKSRSRCCFKTPDRISSALCTSKRLTRRVNKLYNRTKQEFTLLFCLKSENVASLNDQYSVLRTIYCFSCQLYRVPWAGFNNSWFFLTRNLPRKRRPIECTIISHKQRSHINNSRHLARKMLGYLSADIICSENRTIFRIDVIT